LRQISNARHLNRTLLALISNARHVERGGGQLHRPPCSGEREVRFKVQVQQVSINRLIEIAGAVGKWETSFAFQLFHGGLLIISRHILCMRVALRP